MAITDLIGSLFSLINDIIYIVICLFLGGLVMNGWKRYKNWGINIIGSLIFGVICLIGGVLLSSVIPIQLPFLEGVLQALITAIVLYVILALVSGGAKKLGKFVKAENFLELSGAFQKLTEEFSRLKSVLERKKIMPEKMESKELEKKLRDFLEDQKIKQFDLLSKNVDNDLMNFIIQTRKKDEYKVSFDMYTGENIGFIQVNLTLGQKVKKGFAVLGRNNRAIAGVVLACLFTFFMLSQVNDQTIKSVEEKLAFISVPGLSLIPAQAPNQFVGYNITNPSCLGVTDLLYLVNEGNYNFFNQTTITPASIATQVMSENPGAELMPGISLDYEGASYELIPVLNMSASEFTSAIQNYVLNYLGEAITNPYYLLSLFTSQNTTDIFNQVFQGINVCDINYHNDSISERVTLCSANLDTTSLCECRLLADIDEYCFVISDSIKEQFESQFSEMLGQATSGMGDEGLGGLLDGLSGLIQ